MKKTKGDSLSKKKLIKGDSARKNYIKNESSEKVNRKNEFTSKVKKYLKLVYGTNLSNKNQLEILNDKVLELVNSYSKRLGMKNQKFSPFMVTQDNLRIFVVYPDAYLDKEGNANFSTLISQLERISSLGFNAIHILPFLKSPMIDNGFDVSSYRDVREDLGGNIEFDRFLNECEKRNMVVFMDLVLNHISTSHEWVQKALSGNEKYKKFFYVSETKPKFIKKFIDESGVWARYENEEGKDFDIRIIFPDQAGEIPHWEKLEDGKWYYHTFYPSQLDLNWHNSELFLEILEDILFWVSKSPLISFRLDAIPFLGKDISNHVYESGEFVHSILKLLKTIVYKVNPRTLILVEAYQGYDKTLEYFGDAQNPEADLAYNFELMNALWATLITKNIPYLKEEIDKFNDLKGFTMFPIEKTNSQRSVNWVTFLRNHDELTFEHTPQRIREALYSRLVLNGLDFRNGFGVSGRTFSLLGEDIRLVKLAYGLLYSLPGIPAVIYGDEIAVKNNFAYMDKRLEEKRKLFPNTSLDSRDINRGQIFCDEISQPISSIVKEERLNKGQNSAGEDKDSNSLELQELFTSLSYKVREEYRGAFQEVPIWIEGLPSGVIGGIYKFRKDYVEKISINELTGQHNSQDISSHRENTDEDTEEDAEKEFNTWPEKKSDKFTQGEELDLLAETKLYNRVLIFLLNLLDNKQKFELNLDDYFGQFDEESGTLKKIFSTDKANKCKISKEGESSSFRVSVNLGNLSGIWIGN